MENTAMVVKALIRVDAFHEGAMRLALKAALEA